MAKNLTSADLHDFFEYLHLRNITNLTENIDVKTIFWPDPSPIVKNDEENTGVMWQLVESITSCAGIVLNLIVIFVVVAVPSLRKASTSPFIISLSFADLLVSGAVMTISLIMGYTTTHLHARGNTRAACLIWACFIVVACASSALNVCAITLDRYIWIVKPLNYNNIMTKPRLLMLIFAIWSISLMLGVPPLLLGALVQSTDVKNSSAQVRLHEDMCRLLPTKIYIVVIVVVVIILPCTFVICAYLRIFQYVVRQSRNSEKNSYIVGGSKYSDAGKSSVTSSSVVESQTKDKKKRISSVQFTLPLETKQNANKEISFQSLSHEFDIDNIRHSEDSKASSTRQSDNETASQAIQNQSGVESTKYSIRDSFFSFAQQESHTPLPKGDDESSVRLSVQSLKRTHVTRSELKALGVMSIICGTFLVCWLPFGIISILSGTNTKRYTDIREVFLWLAYTNSCLNPIIYTTLNSSFRKGLRDHAVLLWRRHKDKRSLRRESKFPFSR